MRQTNNWKETAGEDCCCVSVCGRDPRFYCHDMRVAHKIAGDEPLIHLAGSLIFRYSANKLRPLASLADERNEAISRCFGKRNRT